LPLKKRFIGKKKKVKFERNSPIYKPISFRGQTCF
jgi:hypothetical protein